LSANSGFVLYLIKVRFIIVSMAGFATRDHRVSACRRSASRKGFGGKENILCPYRSGRHAPPPGLAFCEPDDRSQRGIQYAAAYRFHRAPDTVIASASEAIQRRQIEI